MVSATSKSREGSVIIVAVIIASVLFLLSVSLTKMVRDLSKTVKSSKSEYVNVQNAQTGIKVAIEWMLNNGRADIPENIKATQNYHLESNIIGHSTKYIPGFSFAWKGFDVLLSSKSGNARIESLVFIPVEPVK